MDTNTVLTAAAVVSVSWGIEIKPSIGHPHEVRVILMCGGVCRDLPARSLEEVVNLIADTVRDSVRISPPSTGSGLLP